MLLTFTYLLTESPGGKLQHLFRYIAKNCHVPTSDGL